MKKGIAILCAGIVCTFLVAMPGGLDAQQCYLNCPAGDGNSPGMIAPNKSPDFNGDGQVNLIDFAAFANSWPPGPYSYCADFDCDGQISLIDFAAFANHWLHQGPVAGYCL